jgi:hypothetical protein
MAKTPNPIGILIRNSSLAATAIGIGLIIVSKHAQANDELLRSWILMFTSNIVMLVYLFGLRHYIKLMTKKGKDGTKQT